MMIGRHARALALSWTAAFAVSAPAHAGVYRVLYTFQGGADGASPQQGLIYVGGKLYGTTLKGGAAGYGTVFSVQPEAGMETTLYSFQGGADGDGPFASLIEGGKLLYGTTELGGGTGCGGLGCGTVYSIDPASGAEAVVHSFQGGSSDGMYPFASLTYASGLLYGTTFFGGGGTGCENNCGTVFSVDPETSAESVLYSFTGLQAGQNPQNALTNVGSRVFGVTSIGTVYSVDLKSNAVKVLHNFGNDGGLSTNLIDVGGTLYGTAEIAGDRGTGAIFSVNIKTHAATTVYSFKGGRQGSNPGTSLVYIKRKLYGTTTSGGAHKAGTLFSFDLATGGEKVLHSFGSKGDGARAISGVIKVDGTFYGTTSDGGALNANCSAGCGVVFSYKP